MIKYKLIFIPNRVAKTKEEMEEEKKNTSFFLRDEISRFKPNVIMEQLINGTYQVELGWRIISHSFLEDGISLLMESEIVTGYR